MDGGIAGERGRGAKEGRKEGLGWNKEGQAKKLPQRKGEKRMEKEKETRKVIEE